MQLKAIWFWQRTAIALSLVGLLLWTGCAHGAPSGPSATVVRVVSGQTVEAVRGTQRLTIRLAGLTAPDFRQQPWGMAAKQALEALVLQQRVTLGPIDEPDAYGRQWAYLWQGDRLVNEALVAAGHALATPPDNQPEQDYAQRLIHAQQRARLLGLGIWNPTAPMRQTPVEFRQQLPAAP
ncbi:MAG: thermonuclease family protein [Cyanobacteria bacterium P01_A01_bin.135]